MNNNTGSITIEHPKPLIAGDYYYLRLSQRDNYHVWSSPICVDLIYRE